MAEVEHSDVSD